MNWTDFFVITTIIIILLAIIFWSFVLPKIKGEPAECSSCPARKHAKRYLKKYRKMNKNKKSC